MILAGDIGATNTRLALYEEKGELKKVAEGRFSSRNYSSFLPIVQTFLSQHGTIKPSRAVLGMAGPVQNGQCQATNLPWGVDVRELENQLHISPIALLNDLEAFAWGLRSLKPQDIYSLQATEATRAGNAALIVAGTGLGEAGLFWDGGEHRPFATEGGHTDFGPRNDQETELLLYLQKIYGHVSYERILSGPGLSHIYEFLITSQREKASKQVEIERQQKDSATVISAWGRANRDPACARAVDWFVSLYGAEAGNLALKIMSISGLYVGGKIATIFLENIKKGGFIQSFIDKGRFSPLLQTIPVSIVLNEDVPLMGAIEYVRSQKRKETR